MIDSGTEGLKTLSLGEDFNSALQVKEGVVARTEGYNGDSQPASYSNALSAAWYIATGFLQKLHSSNPRNEPQTSSTPDEPTRFDKPRNAPSDSRSRLRRFEEKWFGPVAIVAAVGLTYYHDQKLIPDDSRSLVGRALVATFDRPETDPRFNFSGADSANQANPSSGVSQTDQGSMSALTSPEKTCPDKIDYKLEEGKICYTSLGIPYPAKIGTKENCEPYALINVIGNKNSKVCLWEAEGLPGVTTSYTEGEPTGTFISGDGKIGTFTPLPINPASN